MLNKVILIANLTKDPELKYTPQGTAVCNLRLASNHTFKTKSGEDKEQVLYITATVWSKRAENCAEYLKKGSHIFVEGRLVTRSWDGLDGKKNSVVEMQIENIQFLNRVKEGTSSETTTQESITGEEWLKDDNSSA
jgi:single-strand DNA-binding protein